MIRKFTEKDMDDVLAIWLDASVKAHGFVAPEFWSSQLENMRNIYIPASETYVFEVDEEIFGFYSLCNNSLAAVFVSPIHQGAGVGKQMITDAKTKRDELTLSVYKENVSSVHFYLSQGFKVISEQADQHTGHLEYTMSSGI